MNRRALERDKYIAYHTNIWPLYLYKSLHRYIIKVDVRGTPKLIMLPNINETKQIENGQNREKALEFQNSSVSSRSSKSETESEPTNFSVLIQRAKKEILVKLKEMSMILWKMLKIETIWRRNNNCIYTIIIYNVKFDLELKKINLG